MNKHKQTKAHAAIHSYSCMSRALCQSKWRKLKMPCHFHWLYVPILYNTQEFYIALTRFFPSMWLISSITASDAFATILYWWRMCAISLGGRDKGEGGRKRKQEKMELSFCMKISINCEILFFCHRRVTHRTHQFPSSFFVCMVFNFHPWYIFPLIH